MQKITVISMGKLKEKFFVSAEAEYIKRLGRFCEVRIIETEPQKLPDNPNPSQIENALEKEADEIIKHIPKKCKTVSLCIEGKELSSEKFAEKLTELTVSSGGNVCFIIGSSHGLGKKVKSMSDFKLSFSKMTFPHKLFRVMLLEQIYRAFMINGGGTYHK